MTNTTLNTKAIVEELIKDIEEACSGLNEMGYIIETCNSLFTYHTGIEHVHIKSYRNSNKHYLDVYGDKPGNEFDDLMLQIELIGMVEIDNCEYEIRDIYENYTH